MYIQRAVRDNYGEPAWLPEALEEMETELGVPIRVLMKPEHGVPDVGRAWATAHVANTPFSVADGNERGVTIWNYASEDGRAHGSWSIYIDSQANRSLNGMVGRTSPDFPIIMTRGATWYHHGRYNRASLSYEGAAWVAPSDTELIVGSVTERNVFDWIGIARWYDTEWRDAFWPAICDAIRLSLSTDMAEQLQVIAAERLERDLREYGQRALNSRLVELRASVDQRVRELTGHQTEIRRLEREIRADDEVIDAILRNRDNGQDMSEALADALAYLQNHPRVESATFRGGQFIIKTDDVRMTHPVRDGESRWMGRYTVSIDILGAGVSIIGDSPMQGRYHPHIPNHGVPCFGGHERDFSTLIQRGDMPTLFELLLQYLETYNPDDEYGRYSRYWFDEPDRQPLVETPDDTELELINA